MLHRLTMIEELGWVSKWWNPIYPADHSTWIRCGLFIRRRRHQDPFDCYWPRHHRLPRFLLRRSLEVSTTYCSLLSPTVLGRLWTLTEVQLNLRRSDNARSIRSNHHCWPATQYYNEGMTSSEKCKQQNSHSLPSLELLMHQGQKLVAW